MELLSASLTPNGPEKSLTVEAAVKQYNSAVALMQQRKSEAALNALQAAIKLEPNLVEAHHGLGVLLLTQFSDRAGAMKEFSTEARLDPGSSDAQNNLGALLAQEGNLDEAII